MAVAAIPMRMAILLPFLAATVVSQALAGEPAPVETALESDDQCAAGDAACALSALQRRGAALAPDAGEPSLLSESTEETDGDAADRSTRRRRRASAVPDLSAGGMAKMKKQVTKIAGIIKEDLKIMDGIEENINATYKMVAGKPDKKGSDEGEGRSSSGGGRAGGGGDDAEDEEDLEEEYDDEDAASLLAEAKAELSSTSLRRRRSSLPPRMTKIQHMCDKCQAVMNKFWKRTTRMDRLVQWIKMKIQNPGAPDWDEPDDLDDDDDDDKKKKDDDDESLLDLEHEEHRRRRGHNKEGKEELEAEDMNNPQDANMQKIVDDLAREVQGAKKELDRIKENADGARKMAKEDMPGM